MSCSPYLALIFHSRRHCKSFVSSKTVKDEDLPCTNKASFPEFNANIQTGGVFGGQIGHVRSELIVGSLIAGCFLRPCRRPRWFGVEYKRTK